MKTHQRPNRFPFSVKVADCAPIKCRTRPIAEIVASKLAAQHVGAEVVIFESGIPRGRVVPRLRVVR